VRVAISFLPPEELYIPNLFDGGENVSLVEYGVSMGI